MLRANAIVGQSLNQNLNLVRLSKILDTSQIDVLIRRRSKGPDQGRSAEFKRNPGIKWDYQLATIKSKEDSRKNLNEDTSIIFIMDLKNHHGLKRILLPSKMKESANFGDEGEFKGGDYNIIGLAPGNSEVTCV